MVEEHSDGSICPSAPPLYSSSFNPDHGTEGQSHVRSNVPNLRSSSNNVIASSLSHSQKEQKSVLKLQSENLFYKLEQIEKEFKHYKKLKHKWNIFRNILHYSKYPLAVILDGLDIGLIFTGIGIPLAIVGAGITVGEVVGTNILEDTFVNVKIDKYHKKCKHIK